MGRDTTIRESALSDAHESHRLSIDRAQVVELDGDLLRDAQDAGHVGSFEVDIATDVMSVSTGFCRIVGLPETPTYPAKTLENLILPEDRGIHSTVASRADVQQ
jgi:PAS domain-containing protein